MLWKNYLLGYMNKLGINVITSANIEKIDGKTIQYETGGDTKIMEDIDTIILATGVEPKKALHDEVKASNPNFKIYRIGDCKKPRTMLEAIHEGFKTAYKLAGNLRESGYAAEINLGGKVPEKCRWVIEVNDKAAFEVLDNTKSKKIDFTKIADVIKLLEANGGD